jgi:hypothetical protein
MIKNDIISPMKSALCQGFLKVLQKNNGILGGGCLRDIINRKKVKDWDVFFVTKEDWENFNSEMKKYEITFTNSKLDKVNVRKFKIDKCLIDSIYYLHVQRVEHVVETFDFTINMLWYNPKDNQLHGTMEYSAEEIINQIISKQLIVGDNLWYRASFFRALKRYDRFRQEGYTIDQINIDKYKRYISLLKPINVTVKGNKQ